MLPRRRYRILCAREVELSCLLLIASPGFPGQVLADVADCSMCKETPQLQAQIRRVEGEVKSLRDCAAALYYLAVLHAQIGDTSGALRLLHQCIAYNEGFDPAGSPTLKQFRGIAEFARIDQHVVMDRNSIRCEQWTRCG